MTAQDTPLRPLHLITLITDFGLSDPYAGAMKGAILSVNPAVNIVDVTHDIPPQHVEQAAFVAAGAWPYFPQGAVHVAVVDPCVGTDRRAVALATPHGYFLGPDNGVLSAALPDQARRSGRVSLPAGCRAVEITNRQYLRSPTSATFHGRDIFGPLAAHLTLGVPLESFGSPLESIVALPPFRARKQPDGSLAGRVIHVDRFGNLITDVREGDLPGGEMRVQIAGQEVTGISQTYEERGGLVALIGSTGYLEIALPSGSAAETLKASIGTPVRVRPSGHKRHRH